MKLGAMNMIQKSQDPGVPYKSCYKPSEPDIPKL
jgi:hypothetical protein